MKNSWLILLLGLVPASALETHLEKQYYDVAPTSETQLKQEIRTASPLHEIEFEHQSTAEYEASTTIRRMNLVHHEGKCQAKVFEMQLNGTMILPRLTMGNYSLKIRQAFEEAYEDLEQHERVHEQIWQTALKQFERDIRGLILPDNEYCDDLITEINQKMSKVLDEIMVKNMEFDCASYGDYLQLAQCQVLVD